MKNLKKVLAVMTAVASLCMSATAFAATGTVSEDGGLSGTFDWDTSTLSIVNGTTPKADSETTILVLDKDANDTNVAEGDILYINQKNTSEGKDFSNMGLKLTDVQNLEDGTYKVKVGYYPVEGEFTIATATLTVSSGTTPEDKTITIKLGDFNGDGEFTGTDALYALKAAIEVYDECTLKDLTDETKTISAKVGDSIVINNAITTKLGDFNGDGEFTGTDALYALKAAIEVYDECTLKDLTDEAKTISVKVGDSITVSLPETVTE